MLLPASLTTLEISGLIRLVQAYITFIADHCPPHLREVFLNLSKLRPLARLTEDASG